MYVHCFLTGELTELGYRKRKAKVQREVLQKEFEEGTIMLYILL